MPSGSERVEQRREEREKHEGFVELSDVAPAVDGSIDGIQQASGHIEGVPAATYNSPLSPKLPVASNDSGPLQGLMPVITWVRAVVWGPMRIDWSPLRIGLWKVGLCVRHALAHRTAVKEPN